MTLPHKTRLGSAGDQRSESTRSVRWSKPGIGISRPDETSQAAQLSSLAISRAVRHASPRATSELRISRPRRTHHCFVSEFGGDNEFDGEVVLGYGHRFRILHSPRPLQ